MSNETMAWLNTNVLVGYTDKRGRAWHYKAAEQGAEPNHYPGPIPVSDVQRRLFHWTAESRPMYVDNGAGLAPMPDRQAIVRSDTKDVLGVFKSGYQPHQLGDTLIGATSNILGGTLQIGSAGLLKGGAIGWVSVEVPETMRTPEGAEFRPHLLAYTSFDGSLATGWKNVVTNVVCDNTMAVGLAEAGQAYKIKHTRYSNVKISEARHALSIIEQTADTFAAEVAALAATVVTDRQWSAFLDAIAPLPEDKGRAYTLADNKRSDLAQLWNNDVRVSPWRGTAWGVMQAVNTYTHHVQSVRGAERVERNMLKAVSGEFDTLDRGTAATLAGVLAG